MHCMNSLGVVPAALEAAAQDLTNLETSLSETNSLVAPLTMAIFPAGADEVSAAIAALFSGHGQFWQELVAVQQAFHQQFVQLMVTAANLYQAAEDANAESMQQPGYMSIPGTNPTVITPLPGVYHQPVGQGEDILSIRWGGSLLGLP